MTPTYASIYYSFMYLLRTTVPTFAPGFHDLLHLLPLLHPSFWQRLTIARFCTLHHSMAQAETKERIRAVPLYQNTAIQSKKWIRYTLGMAVRTRKTDYGWWLCFHWCNKRSVYAGGFHGAFVNMLKGEVRKIPQVPDGTPIKDFHGGWCEICWPVHEGTTEGIWALRDIPYKHNQRTTKAQYSSMKACASPWKHHENTMDQAKVLSRGAHTYFVSR